MAFRVRDLVINVLPEGGSPFFCPFTHCGLGSCESFTVCGGFSGCRECSGQFTCIGATKCAGCTLNVTGGGIPAGGVTPEGLAALKAQLRQALDEVESAERLLAERMRPQSVEEVEALEEKLQAALSELKDRKGQLRERDAGNQD